MLAKKKLSTLYYLYVHGFVHNTWLATHNKHKHEHEHEYLVPSVNICPMLPDPYWRSALWLTLLMWLANQHKHDEVAARGGCEAAATTVNTWLTLRNSEQGQARPYASLSTTLVCFLGEELKVDQVNMFTWPFPWSLKTMQENIENKILIMRLLHS